MVRVKRGEQGSSAVEFALLAPLFVAVLFAIIEFGMILYTREMLTHAGREGARFGVVYSIPRHTADDIKTVVKRYLDTSGLTSPATVNVTGAGGASEANLTVTVNYTYKFILLPKDLNAFFGGSLPTSIDLSTTTVMRME